MGVCAPYHYSREGEFIDVPSVVYDADSRDYVEQHALGSHLTLETCDTVPLYKKGDPSAAKEIKVLVHEMPESALLRDDVRSQIKAILGGR